jgi:predicted alpha/beta-hydrolase family hydrolase
MLFNGPEGAAWTMVLAHGAGQGMDSAFMKKFAEGLCAQGDAVGGLRVARFEFPYMQGMRLSGKRRPPDREGKLIEAWQVQLASLARRGLSSARLVIGGKSLGGRIASQIADQAQVAALVCLGYPFHAPGKPTLPRTQHLRTLSTPTLICQGTRDPFGNRAEVRHYPLSQSIRLYWLEEADHSLKPRSGMGVTQEEYFSQAIDAIIGFINDLSPQGPA